MLIKQKLERERKIKKRRFKYMTCSLPQLILGISSRLEWFWWSQIVMARSLNQRISKTWLVGCYYSMLKISLPDTLSKFVEMTQHQNFWKKPLLVRSRTFQFSTIHMSLPVLSWFYFSKSCLIIKPSHITLSW